MPQMPASWMAATALMVLAGCGGGSSGGTQPTQNNGGPGSGGGGGGAGVSVTVSNNAYTPSDVSIARGATVTWHWDSCVGDEYGGQRCIEHSVTFDDGGPGSGLRDGGQFQRAFPAAGTYTYYCAAHGRTAMSGRVTAR